LREDGIRRRVPARSAAVERAARLSQNARKEITMKTILSALVALSFVAGFAAPSSATIGNDKGKKIIDRLDKEGRGGHQT
jgi:hypothetical protein